MTFLHTICQDLGIPLTYEMNFQVAKYCVDSRQVNSGDLFCALKGVKVDGHHYLSDVAKKGAIAAIVDKNYLGDTYGLHLIKVVNPLNAVQTLAKKKIQRTCAEVIAITGSVGKTTTKLFLSDLLRARCNVMATREIKIRK